VSTGNNISSVRHVNMPWTHAMKNRDNNVPKRDPNPTRTPKNLWLHVTQSEFPIKPFLRPVVKLGPLLAAENSLKLLLNQHLS
jgi:hypothetical protein